MHVLSVTKPASVFHRIILAILPVWWPTLIVDWRLHALVSVVAILATTPTGRKESSLRITQVVALGTVEIVALIVARIIVLI